MDNQPNNEELVTLAIHSFGEAQILKTMLESEGIEVQLANVNLIQPMVSAGVRVRIRQSDLPRALSIIEQSHLAEDIALEPSAEKEKAPQKEATSDPYVLIPVDFGPMTERICNIGIRYAAKCNLRVVLLHAHYTPMYAAPMFVGDVNAIPMADETMLRKSLEAVQQKMTALHRDIEKKMSYSHLPQVEFRTILRDGTPEEVIIGYCKRHQPHLVVMGSRTRDEKDADLIGSVAAEIIDSNKAPILVVPGESKLEDLSDLKEVAIATSFEQSDLVLFERYLQLFGHLDTNFHLFNISTKDREWDSVQLKAISDYFVRQYPKHHIEVNMLQSGDFGEALDRFTREEQIGMVVVNTYRRNFLRKMFYPSKARRMLFHADTPMLVMPH